MLILAASDETREGRISLSQALALARALDASILPVVRGASSTPEREAPRILSENRLLPPIVLERRAGESAGAAMARLAEEHDAAVVVASSARASTLHQVTGRAPVVDLLRSTDRPVLAVGPAVKEPRTTGRYHIGAATPADRPNKRLIEAIEALATGQPQTVVVSVVGIYQPTVADEGRHKADATFRAAVQEADVAQPGVAVTNMRVIEPSLMRAPYAAVLRAAEEEEFDAIAVESQPSGALGRILNRDLSLDLTHAAPIPVLHVPVASR